MRKPLLLIVISALLPAANVQQGPGGGQSGGMSGGMSGSGSGGSLNTAVPTCADVDGDGTADDEFDCSAEPLDLDAGASCAAVDCSASECCTIAPSSGGGSGGSGSGRVHHELEPAGPRWLAVKFIVIDFNDAIRLRLRPKLAAAGLRLRALPTKLAAAGA